MNTKAHENAPGGGADEDARLLEGAVFNQADYDRLLAQGRIASAPMAVTGRRTDWNGLTPAQEREQEEERARRQQQKLAEAEYEAEMAEIRERSDRLMAELDQQEREIRQKLAEIQARPITLSNGHQVRFGANGEPIDDVTGRALDGDDKNEAQRKQKEKEAEKDKLKDLLKQVDDAKDDVRKAKDLASRSGLKPEEEKQNETESRQKLSNAEAVAKGVQAKESHYEADAALSETSAFSALGLSAPPAGRTTSFAATLDEKDSRATALQSQFTGAVQDTNASNPASPDPPSDGPVANATVSVKTQIIQQNQ